MNRREQTIVDSQLRTQAIIDRQLAEIATTKAPEPTHEYAVILRTPNEDVFTFKAWTHRECIDFLTRVYDPSWYVVARRHTASNVWRTDWSGE